MMLGVLATAFGAATVSVGYADFPQCSYLGKPITHRDLGVSGNGSAKIRVLIDYDGAVTHVELLERDDGVKVVQPLQEVFSEWRFEPVPEKCFIEVDTHVSTTP